MPRISLNVIYIMSLSLMTLVGIGYQSLSQGLAMPMPEGPLFCKELLSAGGEDSILVGSFTLFALPLLVRLTRWRRDIAVFEVMILIFFVILVIFALYLASLDCAAIFYTAFTVPDPLLLGALLALPLSIFAAIMMALDP